MTPDPYPSDRPRPDASQPPATTPLPSGSRPAPGGEPTPAAGQTPGHAPGQIPGTPGWTGQQGWAAQQSGAPQGPGHYAPARPPANTSAIVLTVVSTLSILLCACLPAAVSLIFGILGITHSATDPEKSAQMTRYGWISLVVIVLLGVLLVVGVGLFFVVGSRSTTWG